MLLVLLALALCLTFHAAPAHADGYTRNATLNPTSSVYPGVYCVKAVPGDTDATIGIPSIYKNTLNAPTTESPAIIMGAAVPYEVKTGPTSYTPLSGALYPPSRACQDVYIFAPDESGARYLCTKENGLIFVEIFR